MVLLEMLGGAKRGGNGKGSGRLAHDRELCTLCGGCAPLCPADALTVHETFLVVDGQKCTACGSCVPGCPTGALRLVKFDERAEKNTALLVREEGAGNLLAQPLREEGRARSSLTAPHSSRTNCMERDSR